VYQWCDFKSRRGKNKNLSFKDLILTLFGLIFRRIYIYLYTLQKKKRNMWKNIISSNFQNHFKYRNKHYITLKFGTLVVHTLKFIKMSQFFPFQMTPLQSQYMLCPPLTCSTARIRLGIDSINRWIRSCGILPHSCSRACCSSCRDCGAGWRLRTRRSKSSTNVLLGSNLVI
jgi:hypothetical protein